MSTHAESVLEESHVTARLIGEDFATALLVTAKWCTIKELDAMLSEAPFQSLH